MQDFVLKMIDSVGLLGTILCLILAGFGFLFYTWGNKAGAFMAEQAKLITAGVTQTADTQKVMAVQADERHQQLSELVKDARDHAQRAANAADRIWEVVSREDAA